MCIALEKSQELWYFAHFPMQTVIVVLMDLEDPSNECPKNMFLWRNNKIIPNSIRYIGEIILGAVFHIFTDLFTQHTMYWAEWINSLYTYI